MAPRKTLISASLLSADMSDLGRECERLERAGVDWLHVDVMDGRFVPNLSVGLPVVAALKRRVTLPLDVHLMIVEPENYLEGFAKAGAAVLTVQAEATVHLYRTLERIRALGVRAGVALNPATPLCAIEHVLSLCDLVLVMTVEPGFGGQAFLPAMLPKIAALSQMAARSGLSVDIQVDGGINKDTVARAAQAGANVFVSGTGLFGEPDLQRAVDGLRKALADGRA
ncbi:MAG: ribulose-phosphate 3-epimerase [Myxococcales bacterium]|nr:ribulose-phosphate 3-epimerase [Myxococcales bacterium]